MIMAIEIQDPLAGGCVYYADCQKTFQGHGVRKRGNPTLRERREMANKVRLTKKRIKQLEVAICLDDVLYEKFRRLRDDLARRERLFERRKSVCEVVQLQKSGLYVALRIEDAERSEHGIRLIVSGVL